MDELKRDTQSSQTSEIKSLRRVERLQEKLKAASDKTSRLKQALQEKKAALEKNKAKYVQLATRAATAEGRLDALELSLLSLAERASEESNPQIAQALARLAIECQPQNLRGYRLMKKILEAGDQPQPYIDFIVGLAQSAPDIGIEKSHRFESLQKAAIARGVPAIQIAAHDRSASGTILSTLKSVLQAPHIRVVLPYTPNQPEDIVRLIVPQLYELFARGGAVAKEHLRPFPANIDTMCRFGCTRIVVHARDPRQHLVSRLRSGEVRRQREGSDERSLSERIETELEEHFAIWMPWLSTWLSHSRENGGPLNVLFTTYEEFRADNSAFITRILDFYEVPYEARSPLEVVTRHYRKGETEEWRSILTPKQQERCWALMPALLRERFGWQR